MGTDKHSSKRKAEPVDPRIGGHRTAGVEMIERLHRRQGSAGTDQKIAPCPGRTHELPPLFF